MSRKLHTPCHHSKRQSFLNCGAQLAEVILDEEMQTRNKNTGILPLSVRPHTSVPSTILPFQKVNYFIFNPAQSICTYFVGITEALVNM